jgi:EAL domain-containing protein (putative c-di-GMP-specific phosphodiesterase class I)
MALDTADTILGAVRSQRDRFVGFAFAAADLLLEVTFDGLIAFVAGAAQNLYGRNTEHLVGTPFLDLVEPSDRAIAAALVGSLDRGGRFSPVILHLTCDGTPQPVVFGGCGLPNKSNSVFLSLAMTVGIDGEAEGKPVLSRENFTARARQEMLEQGLKDGKLTFVAIEELEALQERLTEEVGQGLADAVERYLSSCAAGAEVTGELGSGRFGVLHKDPVDTVRLKQCVEALSKAIDPDGKGVTLRTATMDLDQDSLNGSDAARALVYCINQFADSDNADLSITTLRDGLDKVVEQTVARISGLRQTVVDRKFSLVYQPIVDLATRKIHHLEALARFPDGGSPGATVAFAEAVRLIGDFDLAVCDLVIETVLENPEGQIPIAVNLSGQSLESSAFANTLFSLLRVDRNLSRRILFEITESAQITRVEDVNARIQALRGGGFKVCLDDFGAGANSFHYLRGFEVDFVKIDGGFGRAALRNKRDAILLRSISSFCREIGVATIGEMIEDEEHAVAFERLGIAYAQGYHFGKPSADPLQKPAAAKQPAATPRSKRRAGAGA